MELSFRVACSGGKYWIDFVLITGLLVEIGLLCKFLFFKVYDIDNLYTSVIGNSPGLDIWI